MILLCLSLSCFLMAQEKVKQKEIGLVFSSLDNFGLTFKIGTEKSLWRFNALFIDGHKRDNVSDSLSEKYNSTGFGIRLGREYRKVIVQNLELRYGADISFNYGHGINDVDYNYVHYNDYYLEQTTYTPGINLVVGLNYVIKEKLVLGAELLPYFSYTTGTSIEKGRYSNFDEEVKSDISVFNYGISNTSALLSIAYRF